VTVRPNQTQRLLLRAALDPPESAVKQFAAWSQLVDLNDVVGTGYRLLPLVDQNISSRLTDSTLQRRLRGIARHAWLRNSLRLRLWSSIMDTLAERQIPFLLMKGTAMMALLGDAAALRFVADCDLLVAAERARDAVAALLDLGLASPYLEAKRIGAGDLGLLHGIGFNRPPDTEVVIDLHWRPLMEVGAEEFAWDVLQRSIVGTLLGRNVKIPEADDLFLQAVVHGTKWSDPMRYDWMIDCTFIIRLAGESFDWARLWATADRYGLVAILGEALEVLAEALPLPVAPAVWRQRSGRAPVWLERREARVRQKPPLTLSRSEWLVLDRMRVRRSDVALDAASPSALRSRDRVPHLLVAGRHEAEIAHSGVDGPLFVSGWSHTEPDGRWTDGSLATLAVRARPEDGPLRLVLTSTAFVPPGQLEQRADIYVDGHFFARLHWPPGLPLPHRHVLDLSGMATGDEHVLLQFRIAHPDIPARFGINGDIRRLGIFLIGLTRFAKLPRLNDEPLVLRSGSRDLVALWHGWGTPEANGCWTEGRSAALCWDGELPVGSRLAVTLTGHDPAGAPEILGRTYVNEEAAGRFRFSGNSAINKTCLIHAPAIAYAAGGATVLRFEFDRPPEAVGMPRMRIISVTLV
jgi:hypothetical protein